MEVQLSERAAEVVKAKVATGGYPDASAFVSDIVLPADEFDRLKLERLRREVSIGLDEINRGEVVEFEAASEAEMAEDWLAVAQQRAWELDAGTVQPVFAEEVRRKAQALLR